MSEEWDGLDLRSEEQRHIELEQRIAALTEENADLQRQVKALEARLNGTRQEEAAGLSVVNQASNPVLFKHLSLGDRGRAFPIETG
jgi:chromosome segregation ATPase